MKKWLILLPLILSMAEPPRDNRLRIELEDRQGLKHNLRGLSCNGRGYLKVREGSLEYAVNFSTLRSLEVIGQEGQQLRVRLSLKDGTSREYYLPTNTYCTANSQVGEAGFYLKDIKNIFIKMEEK